MKILKKLNKLIKPDRPKKTILIMLSGSCCIPGMAALDEQAKKIIEQAIRETGAPARLKVVPATTAMFGGGVPRKVMGELIAMFNQGKIGAPAILINGEVISYGIPALEIIKEALNKFAVNGISPHSRLGILEAPLKTDRIRSLYDFASHFYSLANIIEGKHHSRALRLADIQPEEKVLEVAVGPGHTFLKILSKADPGNTVFGIDLSEKMLNKTRKRAAHKGFLNFDLKNGDARHLSYPDETFDVLYNSYMLDLIPLADMPIVLKEFHRVLKKGGRLVLVNFSKKDGSPVFAETLYKISPSMWFGCRPVLMEASVKDTGFKDVLREVPKFFFSLPSEIVTARK